MAFFQNATGRFDDTRASCAFPNTRGERNVNNMTDGTPSPEFRRTSATFTRTRRWRPAIYYARRVVCSRRKIWNADGYNFVLVPNAVFFPRNVGAFFVRRSNDTRAFISSAFTDLCLVARVLRVRLTTSRV